MGTSLRQIFAPGRCGQCHDSPARLANSSSHGEAQRQRHEVFELVEWVAGAHLRPWVVVALLDHLVDMGHPMFNSYDGTAEELKQLFRTQGAGAVWSRGSLRSHCRRLARGPAGAEPACATEECKPRTSGRQGFRRRRIHRQPAPAGRVRRLERRSKWRRCSAGSNPPRHRHATCAHSDRRPVLGSVALPVSCVSLSLQHSCPRWRSRLPNKDRLAPTQ